MFRKRKREDVFERLPFYFREGADRIQESIDLLDKLDSESLKQLEFNFEGEKDES